MDDIRVSQSSSGPQGFFEPSAILSSYLVTPSQLNLALQCETRPRDSNGSSIILLCVTSSRMNKNCTDLIHIRGSRFFDLDNMKDADSPFPNMLPSKSVFAGGMSELGIRRQDIVVIYEPADVGIYSAPRVGWMFRVFGHPRVHVLNSFKLWVDAGFPTECKPLQKPQPSEYPVPDVHSEKVIRFETIQKLFSTQASCSRKDFYVLDARSLARWKGQEKEPFPGIPSGNIPGSMNLPASTLLDPATATFRSPQELKAIFNSLDIDPTKPIIMTCGSGITAAIIDAALIEAGYGEGERLVYDGSWTEWILRTRNTGAIRIKTA